MKEILKIYRKDAFSIEDNLLINNAIKNDYINTTDIKEDFLGYVYDIIDKDKFETEHIWEYTDEQYENGLTHKENYNNLLNYLTN